jgi:hypothetical protein
MFVGSSIDELCVDADSVTSRLDTALQDGVGTQRIADLADVSDGILVLEGTDKLSAVKRQSRDE